MAQPARHLRIAQPDEPSLDPAAIERAYARERARRRARYVRSDEARSSSARYWVVISFLVLLTVLFALTALNQIHSTFGI
jgi:hypothetical protein